ncbi:TIGR02466 family protein [Pseudoalteromonas sp. SSM20]|uniref:TIGR02466 family protein n=1 Tax=Pseudoalteromonas sp. SSM20 TaxID=3139394 RepID=UPI003BAA2EFA
MKIDLWFATPIYSHDLQGDRAFLIQQELKAIIQQEYNQILTQDDANARSYIQSRLPEHRQVLHKYDLVHTHEFILEQAALFIKKLNPKAKHIEIRESWFNFYRPGDSQEVHTHVHHTHPSFVSGSFYLDAPENSGDIKFYHPNFSAPIATEEVGLETFEACYTAKQNRIVLFRSHVPHSVMPNRSSKTRISLSFNAYIA